jgi:hypothetical protein
MISQKLFNNPIRLKRCTGLTVDQFDFLASHLEPLWKEAETRRLSRDDRLRNIGAGHPYGLKTIKEKLFCLLLWYKLYPDYWFLGMLVNLDASNVCRLISRLKPLLEKAADPSLSFSLKAKLDKEGRLRIKLPRLKGRKKISSWDDLKKRFPQVAEILIDATEQQRKRPKKRIQKKYYSGKKKRHTLKTQLIVNPLGQILAVSKTYPGSVHDYEVFKQNKTANKIPKNTKVYLDRGYQGIKKDFPDLQTLTPVKKNRWKSKLTLSEKIYNTKTAKKRVVVEHIISRLKKYQILAGIFRNKVDSYNQDFRNIAALINFRLTCTT